MALNYFLNTALSFRDKLADAEKDANDEDLKFFSDNIFKFDEIYALISNALISIVEEEQNQEDEEIILNHAVCIALKFYEINEAKWKSSLIAMEKFGEKSYEKFVYCSKEEMENNIKRSAFNGFYS